jgi:hypothetical protein
MWMKEKINPKLVVEKTKIALQKIKQKIGV